MAGIDQGLPDEAHDNQRVGLLATLVSVLWAFFGVQNSRSRERDFSRGSPMLFFGVAIMLTGVFALGLMGIVHLLLDPSGPG